MKKPPETPFSTVPGPETVRVVLEWNGVGDMNVNAVVCNNGAPVAHPHPKILVAGLLKAVALITDEVIPMEQPAQAKAPLLVVQGNSVHEA